MQLCRVEHLLNTFSTYLSSKLDSTPCNQNIGEGESNIDDKYVEKVFNKCSTRQSCIFLKFASYKIGTLSISYQNILVIVTILKIADIGQNHFLHFTLVQSLQPALHSG